MPASTPRSRCPPAAAAWKSGKRRWPAGAWRTSGHCLHGGSGVARPGRNAVHSPDRTWGRPLRGTQALVSQKGLREHVGGSTRPKGRRARISLPPLLNAGFATANLAQFQHQPQGFVHCSLAAKGLSDIRVQENKICACMVAFRVLAPYPCLEQLPNIVLRAQLVVQLI